MNYLSVERASDETGSIFSRSEIVELYDPVVKGLTSYSASMCDGYTALSSEWLAFLNRRLHVDLSLAATLARCRTPQEYAQEWANFITRAANDYRNEFERLAEISTATSQKIVASLHSGHEAMPKALRRTL